ncbi:hypothetical protein NGRA_3521, partial [Nosema granulosis]
MESRNGQDSDRTSANVGSLEPTISDAAKTLIFKKNMKEKEVLRELFIMECESDFEIQTLKTRMMKVIKVSIPELKDWFYEKGSEQNLPTDWEEFKKQIINMCTEQALESLFRYKDESWSSYIMRLRDIGISNCVTEEEVFKKLRKENAPETLRQIFYSIGVTLNNVIERVKEYEENASVNNKRYLNNTKPTNKFNQDNQRYSEITCYSCNNKGHYASECLKKEKDGSINNINKNISSYSELDTEYVNINNVQIQAVFDSGA